MSFPMPEIAVPARLAVHTLGRHARRLIEGRDELRVFARFERSLYVHDAAGGLACIGGERLGLGPLNVLLAQTEFSATDFQDGERLEFDTAGAAIWQPAVFTIPDQEGLRHGLAALKAALGRVAARGLAAPEVDDPVAARVQASFTALTTWLGAGAGPEVPGAAVDVLGLGPGLTPAGDDALGGAMIALRSFGHGGAADRLAAGLLAPAPERTNTISLAHLRAAADGEGAAALHEALAAVACADQPALLDALRRLDRIGHSSGWDALAGARAVLNALV
ncbi:MAG TPA: DUF2877 domain-containing protein [Alphaproteobacteria bacterium]